MFNEYDMGDPYHVEENITNDFHLRRIELTLQLLKLATKQNQNDEDLRILDIGCGQGYITNRIKVECPKAEVSGLDYSLSAIEYAKDHFEGSDFIVADAYKPPYVHKYFDIVICNNLWEHVPDPLFLLTKIKLVLKLTGIFSYMPV